jgi:hypothetical protein
VHDGGGRVGIGLLVCDGVGICHGSSVSEGSSERGIGAGGVSVSELPLVKSVGDHGRAMDGASGVGVGKVGTGGAETVGISNIVDLLAEAVAVDVGVRSGDTMSGLALLLSGRVGVAVAELIAAFLILSVILGGVDAGSGFRKGHGMGNGNGGSVCNGNGSGVCNSDGGSVANSGNGSSMNSVVDRGRISSVVNRCGVSSVVVGGSICSVVDGCSKCSAVMRGKAVGVGVGLVLGLGDRDKGGEDSETLHVGDLVRTTQLWRGPPAAGCACSCKCGGCC